MVSITTRGYPISSNIQKKSDYNKSCNRHECSSNLLAQIRVFHTRPTAALCGTPLVHQPWRQHGGQSCDQGYQAGKLHGVSKGKMKNQRVIINFMQKIWMLMGVNGIFNII